MGFTLLTREGVEIRRLIAGRAVGLKLFEGQVDLNELGYVKVRDETKTNVPGVFVAGDVEDFHYRQAITAAGAGCKAAMDAEIYLEGVA